MGMDLLDSPRAIRLMPELLLGNQIRSYLEKEITDPQLRQSVLQGDVVQSLVKAAKKDSVALKNIIPLLTQEGALASVLKALETDRAGALADLANNNASGIQKRIGMSAPAPAAQQTVAPAEVAAIPVAPAPTAPAVSVEPAQSATVEPVAQQTIAPATTESSVSVEPAQPSTPTVETVLVKFDALLEKHPDLDKTLSENADLMQSLIPSGEGEEINPETLGMANSALDFLGNNPAVVSAIEKNPGLLRAGVKGMGVFTDIQDMLGNSMTGLAGKIGDMFQGGNFSFQGLIGTIMTVFQQLFEGISGKISGAFGNRGGQLFGALEEALGLQPDPAASQDYAQSTVTPDGTQPTRAPQQPDPPLVAQQQQEQRNPYVQPQQGMTMAPAGAGG